MRNFRTVIAAHRPSAIAVGTSPLSPAILLPPSSLAMLRAVALAGRRPGGAWILPRIHPQSHQELGGGRGGMPGKDQVLFMVKRLLPACGVTQADAADALAAAIAHIPIFSGTRAKVMGL